MDSRAVHSQFIPWLLASAGFSMWVACRCLGASHSADVLVGQDPVPLPSYTGTSTPSGPFQINLTPGTPGFLNGMSGGQDGGADGNVIVTALGGGSVYLVGLAINVSDAAGPSHSLSNLGDAALGDIVNDLRNPPFSGEIVPYAYAYNQAPAQYAADESILSAGESANGGQPFDILLVGTDPGIGNHYFLVPGVFQRDRESGRNYISWRDRYGCFQQRSARTVERSGPDARASPADMAKTSPRLSLVASENSSTAGNCSSRGELKPVKTGET